MLAVLRHNALCSQPASMGEDRRAVAFEALAVLDPGRGVGEKLGEPVLALLEGPRPPVRAVQFEQIEGIKGHLAVIGAAVELVEDRKALAVAQHHLAVSSRMPSAGPPRRR
jgi:hypothetical protein